MQRSAVRIPSRQSAEKTDHPNMPALGSFASMGEAVHGYGLALVRVSQLLAGVGWLANA